MSFYFKFFFFFFQAEDGIRDLTVTGVQTCALPIYGLELGQPERGLAGHRLRRVDHEERGQLRRRDRCLELGAGELRSEEHTSELQSQSNLVCRLLLEKKN